MGLRGFLTVGCLVLSVLIGFVISLDRASTGQVASPRVRPLIGLSLDTLQEARWQRDRDLFVGRAQELGAEVKVQAANSDDARQIADVESASSRSGPRRGSAGSGA
jgi:D-xylose transport system substrate-binding protein